MILGHATPVSPSTYVCFVTPPPDLSFWWLRFSKASTEIRVADLDAAAGFSSTGRPASSFSSQSR